MCCILCCCGFVYTLFFFFFKQKTAYEMRISDWSSDVCSSDLQVGELPVVEPAHLHERAALGLVLAVVGFHRGGRRGLPGGVVDAAVEQIGRASCRGRVCQYV